MKKLIVFMFLFVFILGWASSSFLSPILVFDKEVPFSFSFLFNQAVERKSPSDHIGQDQIHVYPSKVVLDVEDAFFAKYADTNSMDPFLDKEANGIEIKPTSPEEIKVGDVISYRSKYSKGLLVHRVVKKAYDDKGLYFIVKGDNNSNPDPEKVRFNQINGLLIGVIY